MACKQISYTEFCVFDYALAVSNLNKLTTDIMFMYSIIVTSRLV